jgi:D-proline reductase (dithiol) PrdB
VVRLSDLAEWDRQRHLERIRALPDFGPAPYVPGPPLAQRRVAIVTTAGIHERRARPFEVGSADYRVIRADTQPGELVMSHISVNFDRTGFQEDINVVFPMDVQRRVLRALLGLFERPSGPVLEDFPEDAPTGDDETAFVPPVRLSRAEAHSDDLGLAMQQEIAQLAPWYDLAMKRRERTTVGVSGLPIAHAAHYAASYLGATPAPPYAADLTAGVALKRVCDDLKAFYYEAVAAQPRNLTTHAIERWFWYETAAAEVFLALRRMCLSSLDPSLRPLGDLVLVPRAIVHALVESQRPK